MWTSRISDSQRPDLIRVALEHAGATASYRDVLEAWRDDSAFCGWFNDLLAEAAFSAFRWETPPVTEEISHQPFEFVLLDSPGLARAPEPSAFAEHFRAEPESDVLAFKNLGGDAIMVVPRPVASEDAYGHLGAFVRRAPEEQRKRLWQTVAGAMLHRVGEKPVWLSTAGAGVSWLHVRLDDRPKYYGFAAYRTTPRRGKI
jgi:hypothetical protein